MKVYRVGGFSSLPMETYHQGKSWAYPRMTYQVLFEHATSRGRWRWWENRIRLSMTPCPSRRPQKLRGSAGLIANGVWIVSLARSAEQADDRRPLHLWVHRPRLVSRLQAVSDREATATEQEIRGLTLPIGIALKASMTLSCIWKGSWRICKGAVQVVLSLSVATDVNSMIWQNHRDDKNGCQCHRNPLTVSTHQHVG